MINLDFYKTGDGTKPFWGDVSDYGNSVFTVSETRRRLVRSSRRERGYAWIVLEIRWAEIIPNEEIWERTGQEQIITETKRRKWGWIGHTLRKPAATNTTRQALSWNPQGKRKVGRPRQTWRRSVEEELKAIGIR